VRKKGDTKKPKDVRHSWGVTRGWGHPAHHRGDSLQISQNRIHTTAPVEITTTTLVVSCKLPIPHDAPSCFCARQILWIYHIASVLVVVIMTLVNFCDTKFKTGSAGLTVTLQSPCSKSALNFLPFLLFHRAVARTIIH